MKFNTYFEYDRIMKFDSYRDLEPGEPDFFGGGKKLKRFLTCVGGMGYDSQWVLVRDLKEMAIHFQSILKDLEEKG